MLTRTQEEILSVPMLWNGEGVLPLAADLASLEIKTHVTTTAQLSENSRLGFARKNLAPHPGSGFVNSTSALGIEPALVTEGVRSSSSGRESDSTGLYYYRARYYYPVVQRFLSEDPIGFAGGTNVYAYTFDCPVGYVDPGGKDPVVGATIGAIFGGVYGGLGALAGGNGSAKGILTGVVAGAVTGGLAGAVDPTFGLATTTIVGGLASGAGDLAAQWVDGAGSSKPFDWGSAGSATVGGAIGGLTGGVVGNAAVAAGAAEVQATLVSNVVSSNIALPVTAAAAALWPGGGSASGASAGKHSRNPLPGRK
jgi:RHS repeat-associated protein